MLLNIATKLIVSYHYDQNITHITTTKTHTWTFKTLTHITLTIISN